MVLVSVTNWIRPRACLDGVFILILRVMAASPVYVSTVRRSTSHGQSPLWVELDILPRA